MSNATVSDAKCRADRTSSELMYLPPQVKLEPLLCRWPAWPHLIAPACHAMNLVSRQLPYLRSFVANPSIHIAAAADPAMFGGQFMALKATDVARVRGLIQEITEEGRHLIAFAEAFKQLDAELQKSASGYCLDEVYTRLPAPLAGVTELAYDLNNHPKLRVIEELLYEGALDNRTCQQICLHDVRDTGREFFMSTPLLEGPGRLFLNMRFDDPAIEELAAMRVKPSPLRKVQQHLGGDAAAVLAGMLTSDPPLRNQPDYCGDRVRVRYFGHACVLLQTSRESILLDPVTAWERDDRLATLTFNDLPDFIDYLVITHCHQDHLVPETLLQLRGRVGKVIVPHNDRGNLADPSMKLIVKSLGFSNIVTVDPFDVIPTAEGEILSLPFTGEHAGLDINSKHCVGVRLKNRTVAFMVDSDGVDPNSYPYVARRLGTPDLVFLGMECKGAPLTWLYGPLLGKTVSRKDDQSRRLSGCDSERAWRMLQSLGGRTAFVYAMGQEPWMRHIMGLEYKPDDPQIVESDRFVARCRESGLEAKRLMGCSEIIL